MQQNPCLYREGILALQVRLMHDRGYELGNLDATIILQRPKLSPHKERIRENLCQLLDAHPSTINIKVRPIVLLQITVACNRIHLLELVTSASGPKEGGEGVKISRCRLSHNADVCQLHVSAG